MINKIEIFLCVLSAVFIGKYILEIIIKLILSDSKPMVINKYEKVSLYLAVSYIITYILT